MKISNQTLTILKNYATINNSILIKHQDKDSDGNTLLETRDNSKLIQAKTKIPEVFETDVCIFDLNAFLSVVSSLKDPDLVFNDNHMLVNSEGSSVRMVYANPATIVQFNKPFQFPNEASVSFEMKEENLAKLINFSNILSLPDLRLYSKDGKMFFQALDKKDDSTNTYQVQVGDGEVSEEAFFNRELLKMIPGDYHVDIAGKASRWRSMAHKNLEYVVALSKPQA